MPHQPASSTQKYALLLCCLAFIVGSTSCSKPQPASTTQFPPIDIVTVTTRPNLTSTTSPTPTSSPTRLSLPTSLPLTPLPPTSLPPVSQTPTLTPTPGNPFTLISQDSLFTYLESLTDIQAYSGWRNSATEGEAEALDFAAEKISTLNYLEELGVILEKQTFSVFNATELWETRLHLSINGELIEVEADGIRGHRDNNNLALRFDSDGRLNDKNRDPVNVEGRVVLIDSVNQISALSQKDVAGKIIFLDYDVISRFVIGSQQQEIDTSKNILALNPAGIVLVTRFTNQIGDSHGAFVGDSNGFVRIDIGQEAPVVPTLYVRIEDLSPASINEWEDLNNIETARITWDADVLSPAVSGNLAAHIPGADPTQATIISAHIDSPNSPGAMDDGSGSVVLMEIARVLNAARQQPPTDLVLVWYGSEELGDYGSAHFVATHQELLDRTQAMLQVDCLTRPLDGIQNTSLQIASWSYGHFGDESLPWPDYLASTAAQHNVQASPINRYRVESDNTPFGGFDVPNANLIYLSTQMERYGPIHYAGHIHSPYDTVELARDVADVLEQMTHIALTAALETQNAPSLQVPPEPDKRAVFLANHTEAVVMSPISFIEFGMALAMEGFDVDLLPYGQPLNAADLADADLVVALPLVDYGSVGSASLEDEIWSEDEIAVITKYVQQGGFLLMTNSAQRTKFHNATYDQNENWKDVNALAAHFGISYRYGALAEQLFWVEKIDHPLLERISYMELNPLSAIPLRMETGLVLAQENALTIIGLVNYGEGEVLALADLNILGNSGMGTPKNLNFWVNLARYIHAR